MNNDQIKNTVIVSRRSLKVNEFVYDYNTHIGSIRSLLDYVEQNSDLEITEIPREELPYGRGLCGYRVKKGNSI